MPIISNIETAILGLVCEEPRYGYELEKVIKEREMRNWTEIGFSSIYYVLKRLEKKGYINSRIKDVKGKPSRRIYNITDEGRRILHNKIKFNLSNYEKIKSNFDLGIAYMKFLPPVEIFNCLREYIESIDNRLDFLEDKLDYMRKIDAPFHVIALFTRPIAHLKAEKTWIEKLMEEIRMKKNRFGSK